MNIWFIASNQTIPQHNFNPRPGRLRILAEELARKGHTVTFWVSSFDHANKFHQSEESCNSTLVTYKVIKALGYSSHTSIRRKIDHELVKRRLCSRVDEELRSKLTDRPDAIFVNWPSIEIVESAVKIGLAHNIPVVVGVSDLWPDVWLNSVSPMLQPLMKLYISLTRYKCGGLLRKTSAITGLSKYYLAWALGLTGRYDGRSFVLPMTYEDPGEDEEELNKPFVVAFTGTFNLQFDYDWLFNLVSAVNKKTDKISFVLAGDGMCRIPVQKQFEQFENCEFPGYLEQAELHALLRRASVGIAHYKDLEHFRTNIPNKPVEYMAFSLPFICPVRGAVEDLINRESVGFAPVDRTVESTANWLNDLCNNPEELLGLKQKARKTYLRDYRPESVVSLLEKELELVAAD